MTTAPAADSRVPDKPKLEGLEDKWATNWAADRTYAFVRPQSREQVFSIDTPPPTVSGSLHVGGHVFSYTHADLVARYQRMTGKQVFYPMAGTTTACRPSAGCRTTSGSGVIRRSPTTPDFQPPAKPDPKRQVPISRRNFVALCLELTAVDEQAFEDLWRHVGLSVDWDHLYTTISPPDTQAVTQRAFLRNRARGEAYLSEAPTMWDVTFQTAVARPSWRLGTTRASTTSWPSR